MAAVVWPSGRREVRRLRRRIAILLDLHELPEFCNKVNTEKSLWFLVAFAR